MHIGRMLGWMFVTGTGILLWANAIGKAWPLFLLFPVFGLAIPIATAGVEDVDAAEPPREPEPQNAGSEG